MRSVIFILANNSHDNWSLLQLLLRFRGCKKGYHNHTEINFRRLPSVKAMRAHGERASTSVSTVVRLTARVRPLQL
jgi:hypothetical protein